MSRTPTWSSYPRRQCRTRKRSVVPGRAWTTAARSRRVDDGQHRVAAGRRVVGEHHDRAAVGGHLDGADQQALARAARRRPRRASGGPSRRTPTRLTSADTVHVVAASWSSASGTNQSTRGPGQTPTTVGRRRRRRLVDDERGAGVGADRQPVAGDRHGGPEPGAGVLAARAEHRRDGDAAAHGEVAPQRRRPPARRRRPRRRRPPAPPARRSSPRPPGRRHATRSPPSVSSTAASGGVADEPVEQAAQRRRRRAPLGGTPMSAEPGRPRVLHARRPPGRDDDELGHRAGHEPDRRARADQRRSGRARVPQRGVGRADQVPAARRRATGTRRCTRRRWRRRRPAPACVASAAGAGAAPGRAR